MPDVRDIHIEDFRKWFKDPEQVLTNFILSKEKIMTIAFKPKGGVIIPKEHAERLLKELYAEQEEAE